MYVSADKYEFPLAIAMSSNELGEMIGISGETIRTAVHHAKARGQKSRYKKIEISEEEYKMMEEQNEQN